MYGLKQVSILAYKQLVKHMKTSGYYPVTGTNEIFTHKTRKKFYLCVYIFWDKYHSTYDADHILNVLKEKHDMINDGEGKNFCNLTLDYNYEAGYVDMEIPGYVPNKLNRLQHTPKVSPQYSPHYHTSFKYCTPGTRQHGTAPDETPTLYKQDATFVQYIVGSLLFYEKSLDGTILPAKKKISLQQCKLTQQTGENVKYKWSI